ncbi:kinase-like protein [Mucor ambiguus]|uniref:dual-specificity kinase n=1 Tax=Mucor ambiguus TaxID=91626 RepID=A0A0C9MNY3_9FUNG|nr:kinase-like protein [Mucor ambiguus]
MQQHGLYDKSTTEKEGVNNGREGGVAGGKYARSTASSRSRALNTTDSGMSQSGIYEAFAEADRYDTKKSMNTKKYMDTRRKSTTQVEMNRRASLASSTASPRLNTINTKKSSDSISNTTKKPSTLYQGRRQTLSGALTSAKSNVNNNSSNGGGNGGLIKLADTLRDTLAVERRLAQQELGLLNNEKKATTTTTRVQQQQKQILNSERNVVDMITSAKRRSSMTKEKLRSLEQPTRRRTLSSGATLLTPHQQSPQRPKLTPPGTATNDTSAAGASYMKPTLADQQRRHSLASSPLSTTSARNSSSPRRRRSNAIQKGAESPSFTTSEDDRESSSPTHHSNPVSALKRRSILAAATAKARQLHQKQQQQCPDLVVDTDETITGTTAAAAAGGGGGGTSSGDEKPTAISKVMRTRKKSLGLDTDALYNRRMSRTESLKEGLPTSPSMMAARMSRRKSVINQESPINPAPPNKRWSKENGNTTGDEQQQQQQQQTLKKTVRKRGKTLPGSLAKPPNVTSLQLPPMKVEPIRLNMPKANAKRTPKSPSIKATVSTNRMTSTKKRMSMSSANTTPIPISSSSSSSAEANVVTPPKKSLSTRRAKGQSHLGISTSRRASLKAPSLTTVVTPPLKASPVSASPRVRPRSTRRQSLAVLDTNKSSLRSASSTQQQQQDEPEYPRKLSGSTYSTNSRKNSLADESLVDKDKGRHRAISLREKLEAMVAQHAIHEDDSKASRRSPSAYATGEYRPRKSQCYDVDDKYTQLLTAEERARPQRIKDTLMMWDKEMVEAFSPGVPKSPSIAIKFYGHHLSPYEQNEIQGYPEVYFVGHHAKKYQAMPDNAALNYGYDDERGDYKSVTSDHLAYRYEILEELGRGSFGQVVKCYDHKTASTVAVKLIRNKKRFYAQAKTEVKILSDLVRWDPEDRHHNVKMTDSFYFRNHLCIACECLSMNLYEFIKINNFQGFHITLIKRFTIQLLRSLSLLSRHGVIHCDLKPENILLKHPTKSTIKVIDFGSSCLEHQRVYTYIQSRFYRSPEIILGLDYTMAIDMWSLGCIIAELYTGVPIFPGENEQEQLACIMEVLGVPDPELIQLSERRNLFFDRRGEPRVVCNSRGKKRKAGAKNLNQALRCNDALFLDFIQQCLQWDPAKRLNPERAFQHEWILQSTRPTAVRTSQEEQQQPLQAHQADASAVSPKPSALIQN